MSKAEQHAVGANKRDVWWIAPQPYKEAHFATFPEKLVEPCILAGTSAHGVCADCEAPWGRTVDVARKAAKPFLPATMKGANVSPSGRQCLE